MKESAVDQFGLKTSVIIPVHKRKNFLRSAVTSVTSQVVDGVAEVVVVKDFSDSEVDSWLGRQGVIALTLYDERIGSKLSHALDYCNGDIISILDDDDCFDRSKVRVTQKHFRAHPDLIFLSDSQRLIGEDGRVPPNSAHVEPRRTKDYYLHENPREKLAIYSKELIGQGACTSTISFRRPFIDPHRNSLERLYIAADFFLLFVALSSHGSMLFLSDQLTDYRVHESYTHGSRHLSFEDFSESSKRRLDRLKNDWDVIGETVKSTPAEQYANRYRYDIALRSAMFSPPARLGIHGTKDLGFAGIEQDAVGLRSLLLHATVTVDPRIARLLAFAHYIIRYSDR